MSCTILAEPDHMFIQSGSTYAIIHPGQPASQSRQHRTDRLVSRSKTPEVTTTRQKSTPVRFPVEPTHDAESPRPKAVQALRQNRHTRALSATASARPPVLSTSLRTRAASTSHAGQFTLCPKWSMFRRTEPVQPITTEPEETIGSFSPTGSPRQHLHELLGTRSSVGTFRPTGLSKLRLRLAEIGPEHTAQSETDSSRSHSPPLSPIPSICRTPSAYSESEYFPTAPSSAGPATPVHSVSPSPFLPAKALRPVLERLEDASKLRVRTTCSACLKVGSNFPRCPRCGEGWCSRECRLKSTGGKKHVCSKPAN